jgi:hypothetical protein
MGLPYRTRRLVVVPCLVALAPLLMAAKCQETDADRPSSKVCDMTQPAALAPKFVAGPGKGFVEAGVTVVCDRAPKSHRLTMWLEREGSDGKTFFQVGKSETSDDIPPPKPGKTFTIRRPCVDGVWRLHASATGSGPVGTDGRSRPFDFPLPTGEQWRREIRCKLS